MGQAFGRKSVLLRGGGAGRRSTADAGAIRAAIWCLCRFSATTYCMYRNERNDLTHVTPIFHKGSFSTAAFDTGPLPAGRRRDLSIRAAAPASG